MDGGVDGADEGLTCTRGLLTCVLWFPSHTHAGDTSVQYDPHQLREVEKRLRGYLTSRVLVFRKGEISRHQITFDSQVCPSAESGSALRSRPNAILFIQLTVGPEHLVIFGQAVRIRQGVRQLILSTHPQAFQLVTCSVVLNVPPDQVTFAHAIGLLYQVFLTREELRHA
jgi:hypothetical protein